MVLFTGAGPPHRQQIRLLLAGDQSVRGTAGYVDDDGIPRLNVLDLQRLNSLNAKS